MNKRGETVELMAHQRTARISEGMAGTGVREGRPGIASLLVRPFTGRPGGCEEACIDQAGLYSFTRIRVRL